MDPTPPLLVNRYRFSKVVRQAPRVCVWLAVDQQTDLTVVALAQPSKGELPTKLPHVRHPHLAAVLAVLTDVDPASLPPGTTLSRPRVLIAEYVPGTTVKEQLRVRGMSGIDAAVSFARLASALHELHSASCIHGAVTCDSIVAEPLSAGKRPVLTQLLGMPGAAYCSPERAAGQGPSAADDVWALHAALFISLTRTVPYPASTLEEMRASLAAGKLRNPGELGVHDPVLQAILEAGLLIDPEARRRDARELENALTSWAEAQAAVDQKPARRLPPPLPAKARRQVSSAPTKPPPASSADSDAPPPADSVRLPVDNPAGESKSPQSSAPPPWAVARERPTQRPAQLPVPRKRRTGLWLAGLSLSLLLAVVAGVVLAPKRIAALIPSRQPPAPAPVAPSAIVSREAIAAPTTSASDATAPIASSAGSSRAEQDSASAPSSQDLRSCVASFFDAGTFHPAVASELGYLCEDRDLREMTPNLLRALVVNGIGQTTPGMRVWSTLGWYELAATALIRGRCCSPDAPAIRVPTAPAPCNDQLGAALRMISSTAPTADNAQQLADGFAQGVTCYYANGVPRPYYYRGAPDRYSREQFVQFVGRAAERLAH